MHNDKYSVSLKAASLGVKDIVFFVVAAAAPLGATVGATPVVFATGGNGAPALYLAAALVLLLFAVGLATMNRFVVTAGGFTDIVSTGLGKTAGFAAAGIALLAYISMLTGLYGQFAVLFSDMLREFSISAVSWQICLFGALIFIGVLGYRDIEFSAKVLGVLMILEVVILLIFDGAVMMRHGLGIFFPGEFISPGLLTPGSGVALMFALACFVGFESTTIYGEEAKDPHNTIPKATYVAVFMIGLFFVLTSLCLRAAYAGTDVRHIAEINLVTFVFDANTQYVGEFSTRVMKVLVVTSVFAVLLSFHNALCRYIMSLARNGFLPPALSSIHRTYRSPHMASLALSLLLVILITMFIIMNADPINQLYMWMVGTGTLAIIILQALGAFAIALYFTKNRHNVFVKGVVCPAAGGFALLVIGVYAFINFSLLSGTDKGLATHLPWLVIIAGVVGAVAGNVNARRNGLPAFSK
ncbi:APC family permease [Pantoea anthophila]|uniref:APC family permease n=1 Tax=Pantoea anthophila TaxID=470931 RepID=A0ABY2Z4R4_9GAMM|nr:APC family permease [Pantoea anthophila]TPV23644.1 APC family permease [Pantoea anthophila]